MLSIPICGLSPYCTSWVEVPCIYTKSKQIGNISEITYREGMQVPLCRYNTGAGLTLQWASSPMSYVRDGALSSDQGILGG